MSDEGRGTVLPYHFVPAVRQSPRPGDLPYPAVRDGRHEGLLHHKFASGRTSGRLLCRLTTETPMVIGGERRAVDGEPAEVEPFLLDGRPAVPASSLRGMISAIAEAASNSALRVLDDRPFSYRRIARHALSELGEVIVERKAGETVYSLRPLPDPVRVGRRDSLEQPLQSWRRDRPCYYGLAFIDGRYRGRPVPWEKVEELPAAEQERYVRGIARVMAARERDLPLFIPYPPEDDSWTPVTIQPQAVERFHELADERTEASRERRGADLPFHPVGTERNPDPDDPRFRLKSGDLVFYATGEAGTEAVEIALSQIWRGRVETHGRANRARDFFRRIDPDLVPFDAARTGGQLTIAEQLFGFVSEGDVAEEAEAVPALASRVRFSFGRLEGDPPDCFMQPETLRILDSPKPPSPNLYFIDDAQPGRYIAKHHLDPTKHRPQGRKAYVHQRGSEGAAPDASPWRSLLPEDRPEMKSTVRPLRADLSFVFHIDFDNLSQDEMGLLLYALRPTREFRHKLGMGKPLGLGTVRLDVLGHFEVDRQARYRKQGLFAPRYARAWVAEAADLERLGDSYRTERQAAAKTAGSDRPEALRAAWRRRMDPRVRDALERLGEESFESSEVTVPLVEGGDPETETFAWFVANDRAGFRHGRALEPLGAKGTPWPRLEPHQPRKPPQSGRGRDSGPPRHRGSHPRGRRR